MPGAEFFATYTRGGEPLGLVPREIVHQEGLWHRAVNVFLFRSDGRLVVQRRAAAKDVCPGAWDLSVAEHLQPGEDYRDAALRGLAEELSIVDVELHPIGGLLRAQLEQPRQGIRDYELQCCFTGVSDAEIVLDSAEVCQFDLYHLPDLQVLMQANAPQFTPWFLRLSRHIDLFQPTTAQSSIALGQTRFGTPAQSSIALGQTRFGTPSRT
jgi:isopentenyl-diphosphate delta-isomerase